MFEASTTAATSGAVQNGQALADFASEQHIASIPPWDEEEEGQAAPQLPAPPSKQ